MSSYEVSPDEVRAMLNRRAADVVAVGVAASLTTERRGPEWVVGAAQHRGSRALVGAAVAAVVVLFAAGVLVVTSSDSAIRTGLGGQIEGTRPGSPKHIDTELPEGYFPLEAECGVYDVVPGPLGENAPGLDLMPRGHQVWTHPLVPFGSVLDSDVVPAFTAEQDPIAVATAYLVDRLGVDLADVDVSLDDLTGEFALVSWERPHQNVVLGGWVYLRQNMSEWWVTGSAIDGVDLSGVQMGSQGVRGVVTSNIDIGLLLDVTDPRTNNPVLDYRLGDPVNGFLSPGFAFAGSGKFDVEIYADIYGIAGRTVPAVRAYFYDGPLRLAVSEVVLQYSTRCSDLAVFTGVDADFDQLVSDIASDPAVVDYLPLSEASADYFFWARMYADQHVADRWVRQAGGRAVVVSVEEGADLARLAREFESMAGVAAVGRPEVYINQAERPDDLGELVVGVEERLRAPHVTHCWTAMGMQARPLVVNEIDNFPPAATAEVALSGLVQGPGAPPEATGWIRLEQSSGEVSFGHGRFYGGFSEVVRVAELEDGTWTVTEWEQSCDPNGP